MTISPLLAVLRSIKADGTLSTNTGLCGNVENMLLDYCTNQEWEIAMVELSSIMCQWPDRKPSIGGLFPVEGSKDKYFNDNNKWQNPRRPASSARLAHRPTGAITS